MAGRSEELLDTALRCERQARVQRIQNLIDAHIRFEQLSRKQFERPQHGEGEAPGFSAEAAQRCRTVGVMRALLGAGIKPSTIVGTSVGALDRDVIASDPTLVGAARLRDLWLSGPVPGAFHF